MMKLDKVKRCALTDAIALLGILLLSLVLQTFTHVPPAITLAQILAIALLVQTYPLKVLSDEKGAHTPAHVTKHQLLFTLILFGILAAVIAYINYLFFFARHDLSPEYISTDNPLYLQATALTAATIVMCQFINLLFVRADRHKKVFTNQIWSNRKLVIAWLVSLAVSTNLIYNPWLDSLFGTAALDMIDWLTVLACTGIYAGLRHLQRHTRLHTRHAVLKLHHELHRSKH